MNDELIDKWRKSLIGKCWEIYWEPKKSNNSSYESNSKDRHVGTTSNSSSSSTGTPIDTDEDDENSFMADWYDGYIKSFSHGTFDVVFVGEDTVYKMSLKPDNVRPLVTSSQRNNCFISNNDIEAAIQDSIKDSSLEWKKHLVGNEYEIYWDPRAFRDQLGCLEGFESDWYEGRVISYNISTNTFEVSFTGEDYNYQMYLGPNVVRPSVNVWIKRTKSLLDMNEHGVMEANRVPSCTTIACDSLSAAQSTMVVKKEIVDEHHYAYESDRDMKRLCQMLDEQISIRSELVIEKGDIYEDKSITGMNIATEQYVNYLTRCLDLVKKACSWYEANSVYIKLPSHDDNTFENSFITTCSPDNEPLLQRESTFICTKKLNVEALYQDILLGVHLFFRVVTMNLDTISCTKKQQDIKSLHIPKSQRQRKRRKFNVSRKSNWDNSFMELDECITLENIIDTECVFDFESNQHIWLLLCHILLTSGDEIKSCPSFHSFQKSLELLTDMQGMSRIYVQNILVCLESILSLFWDELCTRIVNLHNILRCNVLPYFNEHSHDDNGKFFTSDEVYLALVSIRSEPILIRFNLSIYESLLEDKLSVIKEFEKKSWSIIASLTNEKVDFPVTATEIDESELESVDPMMKKLKSLQDDMKNISALRNIESIGELSHDLVMHAIRIRKWVISFHRCQVIRERASLLRFVCDEPPATIAIPSQYIQTNAPSLDHMFAQLDPVRQYTSEDVSFNNKVESSPNKSCNDEDECRATLHVLKKTNKFITEYEEQIAILADILSLKSNIRAVLNADATKKISFNNIHKIFATLQQLEQGYSLTRTKLTACLMQNLEVNARIQKFAKDQLALHLNIDKSLFIDLYDKATNWKTASEGIVRTLNLYGNNDDISAALENVNMQNKGSIIDVKRIESLINEHESSSFCIPNYFELLSNVYMNVNKWLDELDSIVNSMTSFCPFRTVTALRSHLECRPKGILMHPPRHLVDSWIEVLDWYEKVCFEHQNIEASYNNESKGFVFDESSTMQSMILRGMEIIEESTITQLLSATEETSGTKSMNTRDQHFIKPISREKLVSCHHGQQLLQNLVEYDKSLGMKGIIIRCRFLLWEKTARKMLEQITNPHQKVYSNEAKDLLHSVAFYWHEDNCKQSEVSHLESIRETVYIPLNKYVTESECLEKETQILLHSLDLLDRKTVDQEDVIPFVTQLKHLRTMIKNANVGICINVGMEDKVDKSLRDLTWFLSVSKYEMLYRSTIELLPSIKGHTKHMKVLPDSCKRINWHELNVIYDKMPKQIMERSDQYVGLEDLMRKARDNVTKLKNSGDAWEAKVQSKLSISSRGFKRRRKTIPEIEGKTLDESIYTTMKELKDLVDHEVLQYISMQLESTVEQIYERARSVEYGLNVLLTFDLYGDTVDRAIIPNTPSLLGSDGEFYFNKVIASSMYKQMQSNLSSLLRQCDELPTNTHDAVTIRWLQNAIEWVEKVSTCLNIGPYSKYQLSFEDAENLVVLGSNIFLDVDDVVKRTMSKYKIGIHANRNTRYFAVKIAKGGATHSIGGYVLRWIEFCFNGLRGDLYLSNQLDKKLLDLCVESSKESASSGSNGSTIKELFQEAKNNLLILPDHQTMIKAQVILDESMDINHDDANAPSEEELNHDLITKKTKKPNLRL